MNPALCPLRPMTVPEGRQGHFGPMAGGNYALGDGAFNEAVETLLGVQFYGAIAIRDRFESDELYYQLTRRNWGGGARRL
jgi:hypothetical protein